MRRGARRRWESLVEDDPGAGLLNLFDVWIAFSVALLLALVSYLNLSGELATGAAAHGGSPQPELEAVSAQGVRLERYRVTRQNLRGEGTRLGTAYRLANGEVVYVPDGP